MAKKIGFDLVEVIRFKKFAHDEDSAFLKKVFRKAELDYCFSYKNPEMHLAGLFAAKEAASKALGIKKFPFAEIEVRHDRDGMPKAYFNGKLLKISVSISHTETVAGAIALS